MKRALVMLLAVLLLGVVPVTQGQDKKKEKDKATTGAFKKMVVYAKATKKLSARLVAVKMSGGKATGKVTGNGVVIQVAADKANAVQTKLKAAGARIVALAKLPETTKVKPVEELILSYKKAPAAAQFAKMGLKIVKRHKLADREVLLVRPTKPLDAALVAQLEKEAGLSHAESNKTLFIPIPLVKLIEKLIEALTTPNDPHYTKLWGMHNIHAKAAWLKGHDSPVTVAVIDTGVDLNHEDLKAHLVPGINGIDSAKSAQDDNGHGTHCAGTIGAVGNNGKGVVGVCWKVKIMPCKFLQASGSGSLFDAIKCIDFARQKGAKIMSNSWGGGSYSQALSDAIGRAKAAGILFVAAAGNAGTNNDTTPSYPASYQSTHDNVLVVAAIDVNDKKAGFSQFGAKTVHIGAPGVNIYSSMLKKGKLSDPSGYGYLNGTSMATPHVSGAAALILGRTKYAAYKAPGLKKLILANARKIPGLSGKCTTGGTLDIAFLAK